ncbi:hypothetical protein HMPREF0972_02438 [Actinomyces sp. oral taxon 848 str. F0332]|nr:hypothetical protein HMPREF0972_02438 [Actinomyces sp. oral taxon 848 str. F0332]
MACLARGGPVMKIVGKAQILPVCLKGDQANRPGRRDGQLKRKREIVPRTAG